MTSKKLPFRNIAISGDISTGKSTLARNLVKKLGWKYLSAGEYFRKWLKDNNFSIDDADRIPDKLDEEIDYGYQQMMKDESHIIFESHLAGWLAKDMEDIFKILCVTEYETKMQRASIRDNLPIEEEKVHTTKRAKILADKFKRLYNVDDSFDEKYYDLVVDTTVKTKEEVFEEVLKKMEG